MAEAVFVPCETYEAEVYNLETAEKQRRRINGYWVRVVPADNPHSACGINIGPHFLAVGPAFAQSFVTIEKEQ